jgi:hypothetical protein
MAEQTVDMKELLRVTDILFDAFSMGLVSDDFFKATLQTAGSQLVGEQEEEFKYFIMKKAGLHNK